jgi:hypothetical protein
VQLSLSKEIYKNGIVDNEDTEFGYQSEIMTKNKQFLQIVLFSLIATLCFQGNTSLIMADSLNVDNTIVPEIRTKRDKALRVLRVGTIVTTIGVSLIALGVYGCQNTPSEVFPTQAVGVGVIGIAVTTIGLNVSIVGIVKMVKEWRRMNNESRN